MYIRISRYSKLKKKRKALRVYEFVFLIDSITFYKQKAVIWWIFFFAPFSTNFSHDIRTAISHWEHSRCERCLCHVWPTKGTAHCISLYVSSITDNILNKASWINQLNAGITVQILLDVFNVWGVVHYGTAGSANNSMSFGDVSVPEFVAFTGSWTWTVMVLTVLVSAISHRICMLNKAKCLSTRRNLGRREKNIRTWASVSTMFWKRARTCCQGLSLSLRSFIQSASLWNRCSGCRWIQNGTELQSNLRYGKVKISPCWRLPSICWSYWFVL